MKPTRRARLDVCIQREGWKAIGEPEFQQILSELAPISDNDARRLLRGTGLFVSPLVEGVRQTSLADLERTLSALSAEYERGDASRRQDIRRLVIGSRDRARLAHKQEAVLWMQTWLENPQAFPLWAQLRRQTL